MTQLPLSADLYIDRRRYDHAMSGGAYHRETNAHGGSVSTLIARYFVEPPASAQTYQPHARLACFVFSDPLAPAPEVLARQIAEALRASGALSEPFFVSWYAAAEQGGAACGDVFDVE